MLPPVGKGCSHRATRRIATSLTANCLVTRNGFSTLRGHLGDLSWYMRCLNESIARRANREDDCTGRFWQGRCYTKAIPDERSVWACMAYDDLNPLRAGMADRVEEGEYMSLNRRLAEAVETPGRLDEPLHPLVRRTGRVVSAVPSSSSLDMTLRQYHAHVEWAAFSLYDSPVADVGSSHGHPPESWLNLVASFRSHGANAGTPRR